MDFQLWTLSALAMGFMGSFHCVGMCGPIALALNHPNRTFWQSITPKIAYNLGRVATYSVMGLVLGLFSQVFVLTSYQRYLSIALGVLMLVMLLFSVKLENQMFRIPVLNKALIALRTRLSRLIRQEKPGSMFQIGMLNGFLPCGFVYMAIAGALAMEQIGESIAFMSLFGLGTIPAMLFVAWTGKRFKLDVQKLRPVGYVVVAAFAIFLIMRGMGPGGTCH